MPSKCNIAVALFLIFLTYKGSYAKTKNEQSTLTVSNLAITEFTDCKSSPGRIYLFNNLL
jgi:hypothetical protein